MCVESVERRRIDGTDWCEFSRVQAARHGRAMIARKMWNDRFTEIAARFVKLSAIPIIISNSGAHMHLHIERESRRALHIACFNRSSLMSFITSM